MDNYTESKKVLDSIRQKYGCKGEIIFKVAIQGVIDDGKERLNDNDLVSEWYTQIDDRHNKAEAEGKMLFVGREFEKAILECAVDIAKVETVDIIKYIQRNWMFYEWNEVSYERAKELLISTINYALQDRETDIALEDLEYIGFEMDEIEALGFKDIFHIDDEEEGN